MQQHTCSRMLVAFICCVYWICCVSGSTSPETGSQCPQLISNALVNPDFLSAMPSSCDVKCQEVLKGIHKFRRTMQSKLYHPVVASFVATHIGRNATIVEIGTCMGGNAIGMARAAQMGSNVIAVDPFLADYDALDGTSILYTQLSKTYGTTANEFGKIWAEAMRWDINGILKLCNYGLINELSTKAAPSFRNASIDFLFVDGLHTYDGVWDDLTAWFPKVRDGGFLMFNDYGCRKKTCAFESVTKAVDAFLAQHKLSVDSTILKGRNAWVQK